MDSVKVYVKHYCPYCKRVLRYLIDNNIQYEIVDVEKDLALYKKLKKETGLQTVPQVFINGKFVGDSQDFYEYASTNWNHSA